jgi:hypothetical protein
MGRSRGHGGQPDAFGIGDADEGFQPRPAARDGRRVARLDHEHISEVVALAGTDAWRVKRALVSRCDGAVGGASSAGPGGGACPRLDPGVRWTGTRGARAAPRTSTSSGPFSTAPRSAPGWTGRPRGVAGRWRPSACAATGRRCSCPSEHLHDELTVGLSGQGADEGEAPAPDAAARRPRDLDPAATRHRPQRLDHVACRRRHRVGAMHQGGAPGRYDPTWSHAGPSGAIACPSPAAPPAIAVGVAPAVSGSQAHVRTRADRGMTWRVTSVAGGSMDAPPKERNVGDADMIRGHPAAPVSAASGNGRRPALRGRTDRARPHPVASCP